jgi:hypothetical protein
MHLDTITELLNIQNHKAVEVTRDRYQNIHVTFLVRDLSEFECGLVQGDNGRRIRCGHILLVPDAGICIP